jgi:hypothetical protein
MQSDITRAETHLQSMVDATRVSDYQGAWQDFLYRLERIWEVTRYTYKQRTWYSKACGTYYQLQRKDPLLKYLKHARNAETHTTQGSIEAPLQFLIKDRYNEPFHLRDIETTFENGVLTLDLIIPELLDFDAQVARGAPSLLRFKSRGAWYNPPSSHLGNVLNSRNPVIIGKLGLEFCKALCIEVAKHRDEA